MSDVAERGRFMEREGDYAAGARRSHKKSVVLPQDSLDVTRQES